MINIFLYVAFSFLISWILVHIQTHRPDLFCEAAARHSIHYVSTSWLLWSFPTRWVMKLFLTFCFYRLCCNNYPYKAGHTCKLHLYKMSPRIRSIRAMFVHLYFGGHSDLFTIKSIPLPLKKAIYEGTCFSTLVKVSPTFLIFGMYEKWYPAHGVCGVTGKTV